MNTNISKNHLLNIGFGENEARIFSELCNKEQINIEKRQYRNGDLKLCGIIDGYDVPEVKLINATFDFSLKEESAYELDIHSIDKNEIGFKVTGILNEYDLKEYDFNEENIKKANIEIQCENISVKCNSSKIKFWTLEEENPWSALHNFAMNMVHRFEAGYVVPNEKEIALKPLIKAFDDLYDSDCTNYDALIERLPMDKKLDVLFEKVRYDKSKPLAIVKLFNYLSQPKFEQAWRCILADFEASQESYPEEFEIKDNIQIQLDEIHKKIDNVMLENGYIGAYPTYQKQAKIKGIHTYKNHKNMYTFGGETANIIIECTDYANSVFDGSIVFRAYTLLGKNVTDFDKYSCLFAKNGKGYIKCSQIDFIFDDDGIIEPQGDVEKATHAICKKSEYKHLSKDEKKELGIDFSFKSFLSSWKLWMIFGLIFGILMTLGMMLVEVIICLIFGDWAFLPELFMDTPWWAVFLGAWFGFGTLMAIVSMFTK